MKLLKQRRILLCLLALMALVSGAWAYTFFALSPQSTLDQRVYDVASQLKCPVCQNESVADSSASVAVQMRQVVRQRLQAGQSEQQVLAYFADRYGQQILLTPPQRGVDLLAWLMPVLVLLLGLGLVSLLVRDWRARARLQSAAIPEPAEGEAEADPELTRYRVQLERELARGESFFS